MAQTSIPFGQWARLTGPDSGSYLCFERENSEGWKVPPPPDAVRIWMRRAGEPDESDYNWTTWLHESDLSEWISRFAVEEWLPPGVEPDWA